MSILSLPGRFLQLRLATVISFILCAIAVANFFSCCGTYNYDHIPLDSLQDQLYKAVNPNLILKKSKPDCSYDDIMKSKKSLLPNEIPLKYENFLVTGIANGSYVPEHCNPLFSVAILITYRNRQSQLDIFLPYIHNFLRKQNIHYQIYLIEQQDEKPWNKGSLYNIGARTAIADKFPCLILHDVDLLPLDESNLYACTKQPRHMSASIDKFRYVLTYDWLVGGVLAITTDQYKLINGFSNRFQGWGGEDDNLSHRITVHGLNIVRFPREMSRYTMLVHRPEVKNSDRLRIMSENALRPGDEGLSSVRHRQLRVAAHRLFMLLGVHL